MTKEQKQIHTAWAVYQREIERIADHIWVTKVQPYLKSNNIIFSSGMGTYCLSHDGVYVDPQALPKWLQDILDIHPPGMEANSLGSIMNL